MNLEGEQPKGKPINCGSRIQVAKPLVLNQYNSVPLIIAYYASLLQFLLFNGPVAVRRSGMLYGRLWPETASSG